MLNSGHKRVNKVIYYLITSCGLLFLIKHYLLFNNKLRFIISNKTLLIYCMYPKGLNDEQI